jgi:hypothetical protein
MRRELEECEGRMNAGSASTDLISADASSAGPDAAGLGASAGSDSADSGLDRRFRLALLLYVVLAALAWFTLGEGKILVGGRLVELRWLPLVVLGGLALRTVLARQAEKIRREGNGEVGSTPRRLQKKG